MKKREHGIGSRINKIGIEILKVISIAIMLFLSFYSLRFTVDVLPLGNEVQTERQDSLLLNLAAVAIILGLCVLVSRLSKYLSDSTIKKISYIFCVISMAAVAAEGIWWVCSVDHVPQGDQLNLYAFASYMMDGNYVFLKPDNYFGMYPHQLGLAAIMEILFKIVGPENYHAFQIINIFFAIGTVFLGFKILRCFSKKLLPSFVYSLAMLLCIPLVGYTQWVYGEIPSLFFMFLAAFFTIKCSEKFKVGYAVIIVLATGIACLYRKNSLIFAIAIGIVFILRFIKELKIKYLVVVATLALLPILLYKGVYTYYEKASGMEIGDGLPSVSWIAMGLSDDSECGPGGYYNVVDDYREKNCNTEILSDEAKAIIRERLDYFKANPGDAADFFKHKITTYWNNPTYQSVYFGSIFCYNGDFPDNKLFNDLCFGDYYKYIFEYCDLLQILVFVGTLLFAVFGVNRKRDISYYVLLITIVGGFLFSLFWEGKARYIFPYYVMMFPMCAIGYDALCARLFKTKEKEEINLN